MASSARRSPRSIPDVKAGNNLDHPNGIATAASVTHENLSLLKSAHLLMHEFAYNVTEARKRLSAKDPY